MSLGTGTCSRCDRALDGAHKSYCRSCSAAYARENRKLNPQYVLAGQRWREANSEQFKRIKRNSDLMRQYGITLSDYEAMMTAQEFMCAICGGELLPYGYVDHDHSTGQVRDILCGPCNLAMGLIQDDPDIAFAIGHYLNRHSQEG